MATGFWVDPDAETPQASPQMFPAWPALPTQQRSAQGARSPALTLWGPPPLALLHRCHRPCLDSQPASSYASHWAEGQGVEPEAWQGLSLPVDPPVEKRLPSNKERCLSLGFDDDV